MKENNGICNDPKINDLGIFIQSILIVLLLCFGAMYLFINELFIVVEYISAFLLFVMAYNNLKIYKRKGMTIVYLIVGVFVLVTTILDSING